MKASKSPVKFRIGVSGFVKGIVITLSFLCVLPLLYILVYIIKKGITKINWGFFVNAPKPVGETGGGIANALVGSAIIIVIAAAIAIPLGILGGIFLSENRKSKVAYWAGLCIDILQGVPSIIIGVAAYFWMVIPFGGFSAISGSIALAIMMLPIVVRSTEETLKLLPDTLREAGFALGMPFHRVILKVIVPCGFSGIISGVMLAISRIAGETAPLLFTALGNVYVSTSLNKPMQTLPLLIYGYATSPYPDWNDLAWGASCILLMFVLSLNIFTKIITRRWKVQL